jgi:hypothetical protein
MHFYLYFQRVLPDLDETRYDVENSGHQRRIAGISLTEYIILHLQANGITVKPVSYVTPYTICNLVHLFPAQKELYEITLPRRFKPLWPVTIYDILYTKKTLITSKFDLNLKKNLVNRYIWSIALYGAETWTLRITVAYPGFFSGGGGVQQIQLRTEGRENGDLGAVAP